MYMRRWLPFYAVLLAGTVCAQWAPPSGPRAPKGRDGKPYGLRATGSVITVGEARKILKEES